MNHLLHPASHGTPRTVLEHPRGTPFSNARVVAYMTPVEVQRTPVPQRCDPKMHSTAEDAIPLMQDAYLYLEIIKASCLTARYRNCCQANCIFSARGASRCRHPYQDPPKRQARSAGSTSSPTSWNHVQPHVTQRGPPYHGDLIRAGLARPMPFVTLRQGMRTVFDYSGWHYLLF